MRWRVVLVAMACAGVSQAFGRFSYSLLLTDVRDDLGISNTVAGTLGSANLAAYLVGTLVVSVVVGRAGLSRTTRIGVTGVAAGLLLLSWGPSVPWAFVGLVTTGLFGAAVWITAPGLATAGLDPSRRGTAIGIVGTGIGLGIVATSVLEATVGEGNWRSVYRIEAAVAVVVAVLALVTMRGGAPVSSGLAGLAAVRQVPRWRPLLWTYGLFAMSMSLFMTFLVAVLEEDAGWSSSSAALAFTALGVGTVVGGALFGPMSDRWGRPRVLALALTVVAVTAVVVPTGSRPWAILASFAFGAAFTGVPTTVAARISDHVRAESFGAAFGVATLAFGAGLTVGPQLGGVLGDVTGSFRPGFAVAAVCAAAGAVLSVERGAPQRETA
ncbi:MAG: MFS transporter, partial [Acidimicrobiia bacterium]|nr:MFS transporter [Acidimicrobiia bacterium]